MKTQPGILPWCGEGSLEERPLERRHEKLVSISQAQDDKRRLSLRGSIINLLLFSVELQTQVRKKHGI